MSVYLPSKNVRVTVVVGNRCQDGRIGGQRHGRETFAFGYKTPNQLGGNVLSVGRATAIAAQHYLVAVQQAGGNALASVFNVSFNRC